MSVDGWNKKSLAEIADYKTGKLNSNQAKDKGKYHFFTCSPDALRINEYAFDQSAVLLAGNNANGVFHLNRYKGKFNAYQRTYVIDAKDKNEVNNDFIYYQLSLKLNSLKDVSLGTATRFLTKTILDKLEFDIPPKAQMDYIAATLSCLDDKIELNNQINKTLEEMAQAIFKSWFVDFEPFQDGEFEDSEIGKIPNGWCIKSIYDFADFINGTSFKKHEYATSGYPIIKIAELKNGITNSTQYFNGVKDSKYYIKTGDLLFSWSGSPLTSIDIFLWVGGDAILNQHTFKISIINDDYGFVFLLLKNLKPEFIRIASSKQTTGLGHVTVGDLKRLKFPFNDRVVSEFTIVIEPIINKYLNTLIENTKLIIIRDSLLPKLMSGEIRVPIEEVQ